MSHGDEIGQIERELLDGDDAEYAFAGRTLGSNWDFPESGVARVKAIRFSETRQQGTKMTYPTVEFSGSAPNLRAETFRQRIADRDIGDLGAANELAEQIQETGQP